MGEPKQLLDWNGETLIRRAVRAAQESKCAPVVVVAGAASERLAAELAESGALLAMNLAWERGLGTSIRCGIARLAQADDVAAVVLLGCDQPFVSAAILSALIAHWENSRAPMVASGYAQTVGIPALFDRSCFPALLALPDDSGAKAILRTRRADVAVIEFAAGAVDIDTSADYKRAQARASSSRER